MANANKQWSLNVEAATPKKEAVVVEVAASARPSEVISAVISAAQPHKPQGNSQNRWMQVAVSICLSLCC